MKTQSECPKCGPDRPAAFERNHYFFGKALTVRDFDTEQAYLNEKRWLVNRSVLGWGVVCGLRVELEGCWKVAVTPGLALDCRGREVLVPCPDGVKLDAVRARVEAGEACTDDRWIVCLRYRECTTEQVKAPSPPCGDDAYEYNRIRETYTIEVVVPKDACLPEEHEWPCPEQLMKPDSGAQPPPDLHQVLCENAPAKCLHCCESACVPLGTIRLEQDATGEYRPVLHACEERRLVYTNPLLFRLYECQHGEPPPRVTEISWAEWHAGTAPAAGFWGGLPPKPPEPGGGDPGAYPFRVRFDRAMDHATIDRCSVRMTVIAVDDRSWYRRLYVVPLEIESIDVEVAGAVCTVTGFCPSKEWLLNEDPRSERNDESKFRRSARQPAVVVEIEIVGSLVRDAQEGRLLDGEAPRRDVHGGLIYPSGEGSEGGSFVSCINVTGLQGSQASAY
jgi:hypothetical protein